ncbi:MAG TPA: radical SAM protein [Polyangiaceae bacterium]|nr:radical SAM protein [Polyangiaceae bacterium]
MSAIHVHPMSLGPPSFGDNDVFSAFYPLGCLTAFAKTYQDGRLRDAFAFGRVTPTPSTRLTETLDALPREPGVFLFSSYVWNHDINMAFAKAVKERLPGSLVVVGGPHVPRMVTPSKEFFARHPYVDMAARHEGEVTLAELLGAISDQKLDAGGLSRLDPTGIAGLTYRRNGDVERTPDRGRNMDLETYPSPYTTGEFDHWLTDRRYIPLETNRGCPYGCTFCDWGAATLSKIARFSMDRVLAEVDFAVKHRIHTIGFCDANFGVLRRDLDIVRYIIAAHQKHGYPRDVGYTNAKSAKSQLLDIVKELRNAGLTRAAQISMQTTDETVLRNVERSNIKTSEYRKMIAFFHREGISPVSDMMLGLPGQTFQTCQRDLQFFFDNKVTAVLFATSVMPNAPMADPAYQERFRITVDADGMVESTYSFTREDYARMFELCLAYKLFVKLGVLKYFLYYAQIEHGLPAMGFLARWLEKVSVDAESYPISARVKRDLLGEGYRGGRKDWLMLAWGDDAGFLFDDPTAFQREILAFIEKEHGIALSGTAVEAVLAANAAVMPKKGSGAAETVSVPHDVAGYFGDLRRLPDVLEIPADFVRLSARAPGEVRVPAHAARASYGFIDIELTTGALELPSNLAI